MISFLVLLDLAALKLAYDGGVCMGQIDIDGICLPLCTSDGRL